MPKTVRFTATQDLQSWKHRAGGYTEKRYGDRVDRVMVEPVVAKNGDTFEADDAKDNDEVSWLLAHYPANFSVVEEPKPAMRIRAPFPAKPTPEEE